MVSVLSVSKQRLSKLPDEVLRLISMGQYTLYKVNVENEPRAAYALRTGAREIFFLTQDGEPIFVDESTNFEIQKKIVINDVPTPLVTSNLVLTF
jgi:hypothetical protein